MTKKDFNELAAQLLIARNEMLSNTKDSPGARVIAQATWIRCVYAVILACRATSANFDRAKFMSACGISEEK